MKIAHLISTFPPRLGGMGTVCYEEARRLAGNHEVTVFTLPYGGLDDAQSEAGFSVRRLEPKFMFGDAGWLTGLSRELNGFDIVHLHYPFYGALGSLMTAKKLIGFPLVVTYHMDPQGTGLKKILQKIYDVYCAGRLFRLADKVLFVDREYFAGSKFGRHIGKETASELPNGVDTGVFTPGPGDWPALGRPELVGKKTILFVGNLLPVKNPEFLIRLLPSLLGDAVLVFVGGDYDEESVRRAAAGSAYENRIIFAGKDFDRNALAKYYRSASVVAVPSLSESFSLVAVEAMASGAIVVGSDIPGIRGRIQNNVDGFLAPLNDTALWASVLNKIFTMSPDEKRAIGGRAAEKARAYDWNIHADKLEQYYLSVA